MDKLLSNSKIINGDSAKELKKFKDNSIDAVITDPPYSISFLGKEWDKNTGAIEIWQECLRVLKPGGFLLAFSAARTYHILATNIQSVGFEIRDQIMWLYASGFPKAQDIGKAIDKRGGMVSNNENTKSLKTILAKLFKQSGKKNSQINKECGFNATGYLRQHDNGIDGWGYALPLNDKWKTLKQVLGCSNDYDKYFISSERAVVGTKEAGCFDKDFESYTIGARSKTVDITQPATKQANKWHGWKTALKPAHEPICMARKPFKGSTIDNVLEHGVGALNIDESRIGDEVLSYDSNIDKGSYNGKGYKYGNNKDTKGNDIPTKVQGRFPSNVLGEIEGYQKFFYCPKVSRKERHRGFEQNNIPTDNPTNNGNYMGTTTHPTDPKLTKSVGNNHPTVKPVALMKYLIQLVVPKGAHIIDPFMGSGTTGMAAKELGITFTGIEMDKNYCDIAKRRIDASKVDQFNKLFDKQ